MPNFDFESGKRHLEDGDVASAIRSFLASLEMDPSHAPTYLELFRAYAVAWEESGDPLVLDQMRKVAIAGLKRSPDPKLQALLEEGLDQTERMILEVQEAEEAED